MDPAGTVEPATTPVPAPATAELALAAGAGSPAVLSVDTAPVPVAAADTAGAAGLRQRLFAAVRVLAALAIAAGVVYAVASQWHDIRTVLLRLSWPWVAGATVAALAGSLANTMAWRASLRDLGCAVPVRDAARVCLVGQLGKYLPGSVWEFLLQMELGRRAGVPRSRALLAGLTAAGLGVTAGLALGAVELPALWHASADRSGLRLGFWLLVAVLPVALGCAHPRVLTRIVRLLIRITRREPLDRPLSWRNVGATAGWNALGRLLYGLHLWLLLRGVAPAGTAALVVCVAAFSLAFTAGLLVVVSPSGLGAREVVLVAALTPLLSGAATGDPVLVGTGVTGAALGLVVASRMVFTLADLVGAAGAALIGVGRRHR